MGTCAIFYTQKALPSNQARLVFLLWANYLESRIVATVSSAKPGLPKQRKLSTGSVRRSPISGLAGAKVLVRLSEASLSSQQKLCSGQSPTDQTLLHHIDLTHTLLQSAALCTRSPNEHAGSSDFCPAARPHRRWDPQEPSRVRETGLDTFRKLRALTRYQAHLRTLE